MSTLISNYEKVCIGHEENTTKNSELANSYFHEIIGIFRELWKNNRLTDLKPLLSHVYDGVKSCSATHYLMVDENEAKKILRELEKKGGINGLSAETVIKEWDNGNLKRYYENV